MGSFLDSASEHSLENIERYTEESESESTQIEEDMALAEVMTAVLRNSGTKNSNLKRQRTSATGSPGSSTPGSDESHADDEGEGLIANGNNVYMEAWENMWAKKEEFEMFKENRKQEHHDHIIALQKKRLELEKEKLELEMQKLELSKKDLELRKWVQDNKVMSVDISGMSAQQQKYFLSLQDEIFARRFGADSS